jgi:bacillithiol biosynthesis cysteine-adding enzyme BshC
MKIRTVDRIPLGSIAPTSRLGTAYFTGDEAARTFYRFPPDGLTAAALEVRENYRTDRKKLAGILKELNLSLGSGPETMSAIERLESGEALAVVTGQQTAPLTGPLYTVFKALTAVRLCHLLREEHGLEAVPVFWAEGDDHDREEIATVGLGYQEGGGRDLVFTWPEEEAGGPMGDLPLPWPREVLEEKLCQILPDTEYREGLLQSLLRSPGGNPTLGNWFTSLMADLFSPFGLIIAYSRHKGLRLLWREIIPQVLERSPGLIGEVREASKRIQEAGFKPQIHKKAEAAPFFVIRQGARLPVSLDEGRFVIGGKMVNREDLERELASDPLSFSPGVVIRPVLQDYLLPTVAYVGGLSETSYFGQLKGVYGNLGVTMPVMQPRISATLLEPGTTRIVEKYHLKPSRFVTETPESIFSEVVRNRADLSDQTAWEVLRTSSLLPLTELQESLSRELTPLKNNLQKISGQIHSLLKKAEEKTNQALRSREKETRQQIFRTKDRILPGGQLMERKMNVFYFLTKYGPGLIREMAQQLPADYLNHHFLSIEGKDE